MVTRPYETGAVFRYKAACCVILPGYGAIPDKNLT